MKDYLILVIFVILFFMSPLSAVAEGKVMTDVRVIHASMDAQYIDSDLVGLMGEMRSIFRYTSYRQLKRKRVLQEYGKADTISLPGNRTLEIVPVDKKGRRITYRVVIKRSGKNVFRTEVMLKNGKSLTIGGPKFKNGVLVFNIAGTHQ